jgi:signal recognition particle subunit SRP19
MVRTRTDHIVLWPSYFYSRKSRSEGRRVSKSLAIERPTAEEVHNAVKKLGFKATIDTSKSHPNAWWEREGVVRVEKAMTKEELISQVAAKLKDMEGSRIKK